MNSKILNSILISLGLILLIQIVYLPYALSAILSFMLFYLWYAHQKLKPISKPIKFILTALALGSIYLHYQTFIGVEAGVASLSTFLFAKALETKKKRDHIVLFNFALFVAASTFLYSQSFLVAIGVILCLVSCLIGFYRIQTVEFEQDISIQNGLKQDAKHVGKFVLLALPFFVLLFIFFPRLPPLWHIPLQSKQGITGISDTMSPGDIAELSQSSALAFRVVGDISKLPPRSNMYWRALVLDQYDGQKWTSHVFNQQYLLRDRRNTAQAKAVAYQYLPNDPSVEWIMGLEKSIPLSQNFYNRQDWGILRQRAVQRIEPIQLLWLGDQYIAQSVLNPFQYSLNTRFLAQQDIQAQQLARQLFRQSGENPQHYINRVLQWYQQNNFKYSLTPGLLSGDRIDSFLFKSRQGFCEHYASSFVMMMRYVGIPARVVTGYQGGQLAIDGQSWEVRQLDAHAWAEVYLNNQWQRVDPTSAIAPQRIDQGMQDLMAKDRSVFGERKAWLNQQHQYLTKLRIWSDYASYQWQSKVVGYSAETQQNWFSKIGIHSTLTMVLVLLSGTALIVGIYAFFQMRSRYKTQSKSSHLLAKFNKKHKAVNRRAQNESVRVWFSRISKDLGIDSKAHFDEVIRFYEQLNYSNYESSPQDLAKLKMMLKTCAIMLKRD